MVKPPQKSRRARKTPPTETLPVLPLKDTVVYPDSMTPLVVTQERSIKLLEHAAKGDDRIVLVAAIDDGVEEAGPDDVYRIGTEALVHRLIRVPDGTVRVLVQGVQRVSIERFTRVKPFLQAKVAASPDTGQLDGTEIEALTRQLLHTFNEITEHAPYLPDELRIVAANVDTPAELCHLIASTMRLKTAEKQEVLEALNLNKRLRKLLALLARELEVLELGSKIQSEVHVEMSRSQREWFLRQQLKTIQDELGEDETTEVGELRARLAELELTDAARTQAERELSRMARTPEQAAEYGVIRSYLEWIVTLPWNELSEDNLDLAHARAILDEDHFGLDKVKERVLDHLAVSRLKHGDLSGPILCFVGPPGVGKTSLGRSIARATGRRFARISVGGVRDESEIRGHRRTYIGSMPGSILRSIREAGTRNPVFMIDEIDKMGSDWRGDPSSAMLEVLDPQQNSTFRDHYLDLPFDLSRGLFICTANRVDTIPPALRDRMEIIQLEGYTEEEKLQIARGYLIPRQLGEHGLTRSKLTLPVATLKHVVREYTREAGVRELDRQIATMARKAARRVAEGERSKISVHVDDLPELLGRQRYFQETARRTQRPGVSTGLAVTSAGGDILFIEAAAMPGSGKLQITGQIGKVMEESARAAVSWLRTTTAQHDPEAARFFAETDLHIHIPAGAIPKDGPSAGIAMATALASLYRNVPVRADVAMTGEMTLTGDVLPVGGVKQKSLAAQRAGITHVILPELNEGDIEEIPAHLARRMVFHLVDHVSQVLEIALAASGAQLPRGDVLEPDGDLVDEPVITPIAAAGKNGRDPVTRRPRTSR